MRMPVVNVPLALLLCRALTPSAKLLWIALHLDAKKGRQRSHSPTHLARRTGLARSTVYEALNRASAAGWLLVHRKHPSGKRRWKVVRPHTTDCKSVVLPEDLVRAPRTVPQQAVICYGLLQATPGYKGLNGQLSTGRFKWAEFSTLTGLHLKTVKRAVRSLTGAGWISTTQKNRLTPIRFCLQHADETRKAHAQKRLERSDFCGEALMHEILSVIVDSHEFEDNARPGFLVNPSTGERLELDRFYPLHRVAFEFNGQQHYVATARFSKQQVSKQRQRDAIKRRICSENKVTLVIVHAEDLTLAAMFEKVGDLLPIRDLRCYERTIHYIKSVSRKYRQAAQNA